MGSHFYLPDGRCIEGLREARKFNGSALPSPTTVLSLLKSEGLIQYFRRQMHVATVTTPKDPKWTDEEYYSECCRWSDEHGKTAREAGGDIHDIIQEWILSRHVPIDLPYFQSLQLKSYISWHERYIARSLMVEKVVFGDGYAGRVDHVALLKDGRTAVCDVKSQDISKRGRFTQYPESFLQLGAYAGTLDPFPDVVLNIYVSSKPPVVLESYTWPGEPKLGYELFLGLLRIWRFINDYPCSSISPIKSSVGLLPSKSSDGTPNEACAGSANVAAENLSSAPEPS